MTLPSDLTPQSCQPGDWSPPSRLVTAEHGHGAVARFPVLATTANKTFVLGNNLPLLGDAAVRGSPLFAWEHQGQPIDPPPGHFTFAYPRAAVDADNMLYVVWGEPNDPSSVVAEREWINMRVQSLWAAAYDVNAHRWTTPRQVVRAGLFRLMWLPRGNRMRAGEHGDLVVTALEPLPGSREALEANEGSTLMLLRLRDGDWTVDRLRLPSRAVYASAVTSKGRTVVAYIGPADMNGTDNSVHIVVSDDGGNTWSESRLFTNANPREAADDVEALVAGDGRVHVAWRQHVPGTGKALRHVSSIDGGDTWSAPDDVAAGPGVAFGGEVYAIDARGTFHAVFDVIHNDAIHLAHAAWTGQWSAVTTLFPSMLATGAGLLAAPDGRLLVAFMGKPFTPIEGPVESWMSELPPAETPYEFPHGTRS